MINTAHLRKVVLLRGAQRAAMRTQVTMILPVVSAPRTDSIAIPTIKEACHDLYRAISAYYRERRALQGVPMPRNVSAQILAMYNALYGSDAYEALNDALRFFVHSDASAHSKAVQDAIKAARLALVMRQETMRTQTASVSWML